MSASKTLAKAALVTGAVGAATLAYSLIEARQYQLREVTVPALPSGADPLTILHLTDLHLTPHQHGKADWVRALADLNPDMVIGTGDFMAHQQAVASINSTLGPLLDRPGAFVLGSNDYYSPGFGNPLRYLVGPSTVRDSGPDLPWEDLVSVLGSGGWLDLSNQRGSLKVRDLTFDFKGVDDPHIDRDDYSKVAGPWDPTADVTMGVAHAPYLRVLDAMSADNADVIMAGHTHGGQVCVPGYGALVTNCDLDRKKAKGLHEHNGSWVHVSAGIGTNPMTPIRFACRPEATLLTLVPGGAEHRPSDNRPGGTR